MERRPCRRRRRFCRLLLLRLELSHRRLPALCEAACFGRKKRTGGKRESKIYSSSSGVNQCLCLFFSLLLREIHAR